MWPEFSQTLSHRGRVGWFFFFGFFSSYPPTRFPTACSPNADAVFTVIIARGAFIWRYLQILRLFLAGAAYIYFLWVKRFLANNRAEDDSTFAEVLFISPISLSLAVLHSFDAIVSWFFFLLTRTHRTRDESTAKSFISRVGFGRTKRVACLPRLRPCAPFGGNYGSTL